MKGPIILTPYSSKFINDIGTSTLYTVITYQLVEMAFSSLKCTKWKMDTVIRINVGFI